MVVTEEGTGMPAKRLPPEQRRRKLCHTFAPDVLAWVETQARKEGIDRSHFVERAIVAYRQQKEA